LRAPRNPPIPTPRSSLAFHAAIAAGDDAKCEAMLRDFYYPFAKRRDRKTGYAVVAIKAGVALREFVSGPVRSPLTDLTDEERAMCKA
jgi:5-dehydro-4-deoxyglucarate dehydratase